MRTAAERRAAHRSVSRCYLSLCEIDDVTTFTTYAALAPSALVISLSTLALSAMPVHRCTAMATLSSSLSAVINQHSCTIVGRSATQLHLRYSAYTVSPITTVLSCTKFARSALPLQHCTAIAMESTK